MEIPPQRIRSVVPQCVDGVQVGGLPGGEVAKDDAAACRHAEGDGHGGRAGADGNGGIRHQCGDHRGSHRRKCVAQPDAQQTAQRRMEQIVAQMAKNQGVTEELKASDQMKWVQMMSNLQNAAEETVLAELIYS